MWREVCLSRECSSSSYWLIIYRRLRRAVLDQIGVLGFWLFGYRLDISYEHVLAYSGMKEEDIPPVTRELFQTITNCWNTDPKLTLSGRILLKNFYRDILQTRSRIAEITEEIPEIRNIEIKRPMFIVGWPRVGSTFMHKLLSCDPGVKGPPLWQLFNPIPEQWKSGIPKQDQIKNTQLALDYYFDLEPQLYMLHEMNAENADECCHLFEQNWVDRHSPIISDNMGEYLHLLTNLSVEQQCEFYEFYKTTLQVMAYLNSDSPASHHVLKDATHYLFIEAILKIFPDASVLMLHRKPAPVAKSCLSGIAFVARYYYRVKDIIMSNIAARTLQWMSLSIERGANARDNYMRDHPDSKAFYDVKFEEFVKDPIATVKEIYSHYGYEYSVEFEENMKQFLANYEQFRRTKPKFRHQLEPFALTEQEINDLFVDTSSKTSS